MTLRIGVLGLGEVGRAFLEQVAARDDIKVVAVADRSGGVHDPGGLDIPALLATKRATGSIRGAPRLDAAWIARRADVDVVVDLLPTDLRTAEPSRSLQLAALARGVAIVTANKGPLALHAPDLGAAGGRYRASGAVAGGAPILELLGAAFHGDAVERFEAIVNGSTNFILSRLEEGEQWEDAVAEARRRGILEADPSLDLLGLDAAAKAIILANAAWGTELRLGDAKAQGISGVTSREAQEARSNGMAIRLVARGSRDGGACNDSCRHDVAAGRRCGHVRVSVAPVTLPRDHPLVVEGKENAIRLKLRNAGAIVLRGPGAGGAETASAVLSDVLSIAQALGDEVVEPVRPLLLAGREAA